MTFKYRIYIDIEYTLLLINIIRQAIIKTV